MFRKSIFLSFLMLTTLVGCAPKLENKKQVYAFINDERNGLTSKKTFKHVDVTVNYLPWQMQAYDDNFAKSKFDVSRLKELSENYYFLVSFSKNHKEVLKNFPYSEYSELVQVLSFRMQNYVGIMLENGKKIETLACIFQPTYGYANANTLLVVVDRNGFKNYGTFDLSIKEFGFKTGNMKFTFDKEQIEKITEILSLSKK